MCDGLSFLWHGGCRRCQFLSEVWGADGEYGAAGVFGAASGCRTLWNAGSDAGCEAESAVASASAGRVVVRVRGVSHCDGADRDDRAEGVYDAGLRRLGMADAWPVRQRMGESAGMAGVSAAGDCGGDSCVGGAGDLCRVEPAAAEAMGTDTGDRCGGADAAEVPDGNGAGDLYAVGACSGGFRSGVGSDCGSELKVVWLARDVAIHCHAVPHSIL